MPIPHFLVTRHFTGGTLQGLDYTEVSTVALPVGHECRKPYAGSPYRITACHEIPASDVAAVRASLAAR